MKVGNVKKDLHEPELSRHLGPVKAPDELWDRVQQGARTPERLPMPMWGKSWIFVAAAVAAVAGLAVGVNLTRNRNMSLEELAVAALVRSPDQLKFRSAEPASVRAWIKSGTGLDVPMPSQLSPAVQLVGATVVSSKVPTAEVAYRVGDMNVTLAISKADPAADSKHAFVRSGSYHGANFTTWSMRGQMYTVAAADTRVGCLLCHNGGAPSRL
ncbi:MAG TPA: hypothetical protein VE958_06110 [Bryobacteraceae bacterium]|nr:hypothetical protein [Bryobacteraceae bacterium]